MLHQLFQKLHKWKSYKVLGMKQCLKIARNKSNLNWLKLRRLRKNKIELLIKWKLLHLIRRRKEVLKTLPIWVTKNVLKISVHNVYTKKQKQNGTNRGVRAIKASFIQMKFKLKRCNLIQKSVNTGINNYTQSSVVAVLIVLTTDPSQVLFQWAVNPCN